MCAPTRLQMLPDPGTDWCEMLPGCDDEGALGCALSGPRHSSRRPSGASTHRRLKFQIAIRSNSRTTSLARLLSNRMLQLCIASGVAGVQRGAGQHTPRRGYVPNRYEAARYCQVPQHHGEQHRATEQDHSTLRRADYSVRNSECFYYFVGAREDVVIMVMASIGCGGGVKKVDTLQQQ